MNAIFESIKEDEIKFREAKRVAITTINTLKSHLKRYKIGKAGETADERFDNGYKDEYDSIKVLYTSKNPDLVSKMEKELIDELKLETKCRNEKDGDKSLNDPMTPRNGEYITYVVFKISNSAIYKQNIILSTNDTYPEMDI